MNYKIVPYPGIYILLVILIPSVLIGFESTSMSLGVAIVAFISIVLQIPYIYKIFKLKKLGNILISIGVLVGYILSTGLLSNINNPTFNSYKFYQSIFLLIICFFGVVSGASFLNSIKSDVFDLSIKYCLFILYLGCCISIMGCAPFHHGMKQAFFFSESSFYAINIGPFLLYVIITSKISKQFIYIFAFIVQAILLQSLTLFIVIGLCSIFVFKVTKQLFVYSFFYLLSIIVLFANININYYFERINFGSSNNNISSLAFLSGLERASLIFSEHRWFGLGFQQLGFIGNQGEILSKLDLLGVADLNLTDGSFVAAKFISEFGIFAFIVIVIYIVKWYKIFVFLRTISFNYILIDNHKLVFFQCCIIMYSVDLFCRGTGYFTPTGFLFMISLIWLSLYNYSYNHNKQSLL